MMNWLPVGRWFYGLASAFIGGGASAVVSTFTVQAQDPDHYNFTTEWRHTATLFGVTFAVSGALSAFMYLKQAPLPQWDGIDRRGE